MKTLAIYSYARLPLILVVVGSMAGFLAFLASTNIFQVSPILLKAVTIDLVVTLPVFYWLLIRNTRIPNTTVIPIAIAGYFIGRQIIPVQHQGYLDFTGTYLLPAIEIGLISFLVYNIRRVRKAYLIFKKENEVPEALRKAFEVIYPKGISAFLTHELLFFYYALFSWKHRMLDENEFTYHKNSGIRAIYAVIIFLVVVETGVLHILIQPYAPIIAWIISFLSIYSGFILVGLSRSLSKLPLRIDAESLHIRYGLINTASIPLISINEIVMVKSSSEIDFKQISPLGVMEESNIIIHLNHPETLHGFYGIKSTFKSIGLFVDEPKDFIDRVENQIEK